LDRYEAVIIGAKDLANWASGLDLGRMVEMLLKHALFSSMVCDPLFQEAL